MMLCVIYLTCYNMCDDVVAPYLPSLGVELYKEMTAYQQTMCDKVMKFLSSLSAMYNQLMLGITFVMCLMEWAIL